MRYWLWRISRWLPRSLQVAPYRLSYGVLRWAFRDSGLTLSARNSYVSGRLEPFMSDLDLTVIAPKERRQDVLRRISAWRRVLRLLGELNLYSSESLPEALKLMNPVERSRDPLLAPAEKPTLAQQLVFISRMLEADWQGLGRRTEARQRKWRGHFEDLGWRVPPIVTRELVLDRIASCLDRPREAVEVVSRFLERSSPIHDFPENRHPVLQALLFHRVCFLAPAESLTPLEWEIISEQTRWEKWALYAVPSSDSEQVARHVENMDRFASGRSLVVG
jgi:hypothetical protein